MCHFPILVGIHPVANVQSRRRKNQCHTEKQSLQFCIFSCATDILSFDTRACHLGQKRKQTKKEEKKNCTNNEWCAGKQTMWWKQSRAGLISTAPPTAHLSPDTHTDANHIHTYLNISSHIFP